ncbi:MAG: hypothetical protein SOX43_00765 [Pelistega sp.]|nr:hypothetical protein [Pelistega sp.]
MNKEQQQLQIQTLLLKAQLDRVQLKQATQQLQQNLKPATIKANIVSAGSQTFANVLPTVPAAFDFLQKYPGLSLSIAKGLMRLARTRSGIVRTIALGAASWFVYNRFQKKDEQSLNS